MKKILLTIAGCVAMGVSGFAQLALQDFESTTGTALPTGWSQTVAAGLPNDSVGWNTGINTALASTDFAIPAHTRFVAVNDDKHQGAANTNTFLSSPSFALGTGSWYLNFDCSYLHRTYMSITEAATVEVSTDGGTTWTVLATLDGNSAYWWESRYINMSAYAGMSNVKVGFRYKDNTGWVYGLALDNIKVFQPAVNDIALIGIGPATGTPASYGLAGTTKNVLGAVFNNGSTTITSFNAVYVFNGGAPVVSTISGVSIAPFTTATFTCTTPVTMPAAVGPYQLRLLANVTGDVNAVNDTSVLDTLTTVGFLPTKVLAFEEGTGTWCQWCPRGAVFMDSLHTLYGNNVSLIAVHNRTSDPMQIPAYDAYVSSNIGGYPSVLMDRKAEYDPSELLGAYTDHSGDFGFADITATPTWTTTNLSVGVTVKPAIDLNGATIALVVTEDSVHGTASGYNQANAYSSNPTSSLTGGGINYNALPNPIPAASMYYSHVARSITPSVTGSTTLLPASMTNGTTYNCTMSAPITSTWAYNKLHGVVLLLGANGNVLNSRSFSKALGVSNIEAGIENVVVFPNPASTTATLVFDMKNSAKVDVTVFDMLGRVVYTTPATQVAAGTDRISIPLNNFSTGTYTVKVQTETGMISTKFNVVK